MTGELADLASRFEGAACAAGARQPSRAIFEALVARYGEPHRHYHTLAHVDACLVWLDWFCGAAERAHEVELALWFHDAVYEPRAESGQNERHSARLARDALGSLGVSSVTLDRIADYIRATERHDARYGDAALVVDLDLTILGSPAADFERFELQIRREYADVPDPAYRIGRRRVLETFLSRSSVYRVPPIREQLERQARVNLERRVNELSRGLA